MDAGDLGEIPVDLEYFPLTHSQQLSIPRKHLQLEIQGKDSAKVNN